MKSRCGEQMCTDVLNRCGIDVVMYTDVVSRCDELYIYAVQMWYRCGHVHRCDLILIVLNVVRPLFCALTLG